MGYQKAMMDFQRQLNLINRNVMVNPPKRVPVNHISTNQSNKNMPNKKDLQKKCC